MIWDWSQTCHMIYNNYVTISWPNFYLYGIFINMSQRSTWTPTLQGRFYWNDESRLLGVIIHVSQRQMKKIDSSLKLCITFLFIQSVSFPTCFHIVSFMFQWFGIKAIIGAKIEKRWNNLLFIIQFGFISLVLF